MARKKMEPDHQYFDIKSKRDWIAKNTRTISVKLNNHTDADILAHLESLDVSYASVIKTALREYMARHPQD